MTAYIYRKPDLVKLWAISHELNEEKIYTNYNDYTKYKSMHILTVEKLVHGTLTEGEYSEVACELIKINTWCQNFRILSSVDSVM